MLTVKTQKHSKRFAYALSYPFRYAFWWAKRSFCKCFGHKIICESWNSYHSDYWYPEVEHFFYCARCDETLTISEVFDE